jgi:hypothetical protein
MAVAFNADFSGFADPQIRTCGMPNEQQNNACPLEFGGRAYAAATSRPTDTVFWFTAATRPRRGTEPTWFAEYGGNGIAIFDPSTSVIKERTLLTSWSRPTALRLRSARRFGLARCQ